MPLAKKHPCGMPACGVVKALLSTTARTFGKKVSELGTFFEGILADDSSYRKITPSVNDVPDTLQRTAFRKNSDS